MYGHALFVCDCLYHMCQTQARGPNLAQNVILIGPRGHIKCALELARGLYQIFYFQFSLSCACNIKIWMCHILYLSKIKAYFHMKRLNSTYQLELIFQYILNVVYEFTSQLTFGPLGT